MKIAVTGAAGGLGRAFLARVPPEHEVVPFDHEELPVEDLETVTRRIERTRPEIVLHLAAMTSVDGCELDPVGAFRVNALGTANVALAARGVGALLVVVSTDYVFDGTKGEPYHEFDAINPLSMYGLSKLAGEREARVLADHLIVRTSWLFGAADDFVARSVRQLADGESVGALVDRTGTPTHVGHLAERFLPLVASGRRGVVHLAGPEETSWHDLLVRAKRFGDLPGEIIERKSGDLGLPAPRPARSPLTSVVLKGTDVPTMPPLDEGIREVVESLRGH